MELVQGLLIITSVHLLAAASPGPDFVLVSQQTISNGKKAGLLCSIGIALGLSIHILYSAFGLAAIIANSTTALLVIKLLGGSYLIFLGIKGLRSKSNAKRTTEGQQKTTAPQHSPLKTIGLGFLCNALNPKAPIYFVSLFTIVISTDTSASHLVRYIGDPSGHLRHLDDGNPTSLVLTGHCNALNRKGRRKAAKCRTYY